MTGDRNPADGRKHDWKAMVDGFISAALAVLAMSAAWALLTGVEAASGAAWSGQWAVLAIYIVCMACISAGAVCDVFEGPADDTAWPEEQNSRTRGMNPIRITRKHARRVKTIISKMDDSGRGTALLFISFTAASTIIYLASLTIGLQYRIRLALLMLSGFFVAFAYIFGSDTQENAEDIREARSADPETGLAKNVVVLAGVKPNDPRQDR